MKKAINVLLLGALFVLAACATNQRLPEDLSGITVDNVVFAVTPEYEDVQISFNVNVPANYFERRVTLTILPSVVYDNGDIDKLPAKSVQGRSVIETTYPVVDWALDNTIPYTVTVPFHEGMVTAVLNIDGRVYNCLSKVEYRKNIMDAPFAITMPPYCPLPRNKVSIIPESVCGKIIFPVNKWDLDLADYTHIISTVDSLKAYQEMGAIINKIEVFGNASPEGPRKGNNLLAQNRANVSKTYIEGQLKAAEPAEKWEIGWTSNTFWKAFLHAINDDLNGLTPEEKREIVGKIDEKKSEASNNAIVRREMKKEKIGKVMNDLRYGKVTIHFEPILQDENAEYYAKLDKVIVLINESKIHNALNMLLEMDQEDPVVLWYEYICYTRLNRNHKAKECRDRALEINPCIMEIVHPCLVIKPCVTVAQ